LLVVVLVVSCRVLSCCRSVLVRLVSGNVIWGLLPTERHFTAYLDYGWGENHSPLTATHYRSGSGAAAPTGLLPPLLGPPPQGAPHTCVTGPAGISLTTGHACGPMRHRSGARVFKRTPYI
jgi:hypothetical protein